MTDDKLPDRLPTTLHGLHRAQQRLATARTRYLAVCATNEEAAGSGDSSVWHDNFAYEENQRQMHALATRVRELASILARMVVVDIPREPEEVSVGCAVTVVDMDSGAERTVIVGGWDDSDVEHRRVALNSPMGRALAGARVGESRTCPGAGGVREVEIVAISSATEGSL